MMNYELIAKNAKEFFTLIQQKGGSLDDIDYEDKKEIFSEIANVLHKTPENKKLSYSSYDLTKILMGDHSFIDFVKKLAQDAEFNQNPKNKYVFLNDEEAFLSSVVGKILSPEEWVKVIEKNPMMYNIMERHPFRNVEAKVETTKNDEFRLRLINAIVDYNLKESPDLTYKGVFNELKIEPHYRILESLTFEETKQLLRKDARYLFFCDYFKNEIETKVRNLLSDEKLKEKLVNHFINMIKIDLKENGDNGLNSNLKRKINKIVVQGEKIFEKNIYCLNEKELVSLINLDNFFVSYLYHERNENILKDYMKEKIDNNINNLFTRFDLMTKADKIIFHELHNFINVLKIEDKEKIVKRIIKKDGNLGIFENEIPLFCELFKIEPSFITKIEYWRDFNQLFNKPFDDIIYNVLKDEKEEYSKGDLINASMVILKETNQNKYSKNYFISDIIKEAIRKIIKHGHDDIIKYDLMKLTTLTSYPEVQDFIIKEMQEKNRDNLFPTILFLKDHINEQFFAKIKNIVSKERKEEKKAETNKKSSLENLVDSIVFKNKANEVKIKND